MRRLARPWRVALPAAIFRTTSAAARCCALCSSARRLPVVVRWASTAAHQQKQKQKQKYPPPPLPDAAAASHDEPPPMGDEDIARLAKKPLHQLRLADLVKHGWPPLGEEALLQSANFSLELIPVRLARRLQALRNLPYIVVSNSHVRQIYGNYHHSLRSLLPWWRRIRSGGGGSGGNQAGHAGNAGHAGSPGNSGRSDSAVATLDDEIAFTDVLAELVATHQNTIPILAQGFLECRKYISPAEVTAFLDEHLRARIGTRLIAEQHIALHLSSRPFGGSAGSPASSPTSPSSSASSSASSDAAASSSSDLPPSYIGIIDTQLRPARTIDSCAGFVADICELTYGVRPHWRIDGEPDTTFAYVPMHLEYIVTELLKNAFRAVVENRMHHEPIVITIAPEPPEPPHRLSPSSPSTAPPTAAALAASNSSGPAAILPLDDNAPGVTIRIRDRGGGISPDVLPNIWSYSFTTFADAASASSAGDDLPANATGASDGLNLISSANDGSSSIAGLGYGLPLSRAYAEFFGGGIAVQSLYGWGTDVYLRLKGVGKVGQV